MSGQKSLTVYRDCELQFSPVAEENPIRTLMLHIFRKKTLFSENFLTQRFGYQTRHLAAAHAKREL